MKRTALFAIVGGFVLVASLLPASAEAAPFRLRVEDIIAGVGFVVTDNAPGDSNLLAGVISVSSSVGAFIVTVTTGLTQPLPPVAGTASSLNVNHVSISTSAGGTLRISLEDLGYDDVSPGLRTFMSQAGGVLTGPSTVTFRSWVNSANSVIDYGPDTGPPPALLAALGAVPAGS
jgi:hypothetical protein